MRRTKVRADETDEDVPRRSLGSTLRRAFSLPFILFRLVHGEPACQIISTSNPLRASFHSLVLWLIVIRFTSVPYSHHSLSLPFSQLRLDDGYCNIEISAVLHYTPKVRV